MVIAKILAYVGAAACVLALLVGTPVEYLLAYTLMMMSALVWLALDNRRLRHQLNPSTAATGSQIVPAIINGRPTTITLGSGGRGRGRTVLPHN